MKRPDDLVAILLVELEIDNIGTFNLPIKTIGLTNSVELAIKMCRERKKMFYVLITREMAKGFSEKCKTLALGPDIGKDLGTFKGKKLKHTIKQAIEMSLN
jgi:hypothetical protein